MKNEKVDKVEFGEQKICANCNYFAQGKGCSFCEHPQQTNTELKQYSYWPFSCDLFLKGIAQSRIDFMKKQKA